MLFVDALFLLISHFTSRNIETLSFGNIVHQYYINHINHIYIDHKDISYRKLY